MATFSAGLDCLNHKSSFSQKINFLTGSSSRICAQNHLKRKKTSTFPGTKMLSICMVMDDKNQDNGKVQRKLFEKQTRQTKEHARSLLSRAEERQERKKSERLMYLSAAILSTLGITSMATMSFCSKFSGKIEGGEFPFLEMFGTLAFAVGAFVGMEFWARWAHRALWHGTLWQLHESHHRPRDGPFELNDVFVVINSVPAIALLSYGFVSKGLFPALCLGAGLGITIYGMAYMFIHDGLVHRRFPVGPIGQVPYLRRVAAAHQIHHSERHNGVPYGLFMGPQELVKVGGTQDLEKEVQRRIKSTQESS